MIIEDEEQRFVRKIPVIKIQKYSLEEIFEKKYRLDKLEQSDEIDELEKQCIITSTREVLRLIAKRYKKIVTEGERVMGGELLEYPAKTSYREGRAEGIEETVVNYVKKLLSKHMTIEEVADLLDLDINKVKEIERKMFAAN